MRKNDIKAAAWIVSVPLMLAALFGAAGLRVNWTPSVPVGLWIVVNDSEALALGDFVSFNARDFFRDNPSYDYEARDPAAFYIKKVCGTPQDRVLYDEERGVHVNGSVISNSLIASKDGDGRDMMHVTYPILLQGDEYWLASEHPGGYDSRYFGPVRKMYIDERLRPLWVVRR